MAGRAWLQRQPFTQADQIAVMGNSFFGIEAVLEAADNGYCAAVDVAGGAESWSLTPTLQETMKRAVRKSRTPISFVQAENDFDVAQRRALYDAMRLAGLTCSDRRFS